MSNVKNDSYPHSLEPLLGIKMKVSSLAQRKLIAAAQASEKVVQGGTEIRGALFFDDKDPLYVKDIAVMDAIEASGGHIESEGADQVKLFKEWIIAHGMEKAQQMLASMKGDWHKHPGEGRASPSGTDTGTVYTRMKLHIDQDYYPFIITNCKGEISSFLCLKVEGKNSVVNLEPEILIYSIDTEIVYDEVDQSAAIDAVIRAEDEKAKVEAESKAAIEQLQTRIKNIEETQKSRIEAIDKTTDDHKTKLIEAITPSTELQEAMLAEIRQRLPPATFQRQQRHGSGQSGPAGDSNSVRPTSGNTGYNIGYNAGHQSTIREIVARGQELIDGKPVAHNRSDFEDLTDEQVQFLAAGQCPETGFTLRAKECQECAFFITNSRGGECGAGFLLPRKAVAWEHNFRMKHRPQQPQSAPQRMTQVNPKTARELQERLDMATESQIIREANNLGF